MTLMIFLMYALLSQVPLDFKDRPIVDLTLIRSCLG